MNLKRILTVKGKASVHDDGKTPVRDMDIVDMDLRFYQKRLAEGGIALHTPPPPPAPAPAPKQKEDANDG